MKVNVSDLKKIKKNKNKKHRFFVILIIVLGAVLGTLFRDDIENFVNENQTPVIKDVIDGEEGTIYLDTSKQPTVQNDPNETSEAKVTFIDVGQGDGVLIQFNNMNVLIDSGLVSAEQSVKDTLNKNGVTKLDHIIVSHPHADHMGSMSRIIDDYEVGKFYMADVSEHMPTTKVFSDMLESLERKALGITIPKPYDYIYKSRDSYLKIINDAKKSGDKTKNYNEYSLAVEFKFKNNVFLFTGDGEKLVEEDIVRNNPNLRVDVFKAGHHGSSTSNSKELLNLIKPKHAVIQAAEKNQYGHPHQEVLDLFGKMNVEIHENSKEGNIVFISDGNTITKQ